MYGLDDYSIFMMDTLRNESDPKNSSILSDNKVQFNGFYREKFLKCFELISDMETHRDIEELYFYYNVTKLFRDWGQYLTTPGPAHKMLIYFKIHYPGQFLLSDTPVGVKYDIFKGQNAMYLQVLVRDLEIIQRRPTRKKVCSKNTEDYDTMILKSHIKENECRIPYYTVNDSFPLCDTKEKMEASKFN